MEHNLYLFLYTSSVIIVQKYRLDTELERRKIIWTSASSADMKILNKFKFSLCKNCFVFTNSEIFFSSSKMSWNYILFYHLK